MAQSQVELMEIFPEYLVEHVSQDTCAPKQQIHAERLSNIVRRVLPAHHLLRLLGNFTRKRGRDHFELRGQIGRMSMFEVIAEPTGLLVRLETLGVLADIDAVIFAGDVGVDIGLRRSVIILC